MFGADAETDDTGRDSPEKRNIGKRKAAAV